MTPADQPDRPDTDLRPAEPDEEFYDELDDAKQSGGRSCCTVWTLGLLLVALLAFGLWLIFKL